MVNPVRHFGTAVRHHQHWNILDPDVALWHEPDSPTIDFMRNELQAFMAAVLPLAATNAAQNFSDGQEYKASGEPKTPEAVMVMIFEAAGARVYQNARDLALHFARLREADNFRDSLYEKLDQAVTTGRPNDARSCAEFLLSN
jgi:hypothetical protein